MNHHRQFLFLFLVHVSGGAGQLDDQPWRQIPAVGRLCPGQDVCPESRTGNLSEQRLTDSSSECCTECSCDPSCSNHDNCCFLGTIGKTDREYEECMYARLIPPTNVKSVLSEAFLMVTKKPSKGCTSTFRSKYTHMKSCCEVDVAPWGSFHPVWSPSRQTIYTNRLYAACHGVSDAIAWSVIKACSDVLEITEMGGCNVFFRQPAGIKEIRKKQCFTNMFGKCPKRFSIKPKLKFLTKDEVIQGCEGNFISPHNGRYSVKNVFCYICLYSPYAMPAGECSGTVDTKSSLSQQYSVISIIDQHYLEHYEVEKKPTHELACRITENGEIVKSSCRELLCPVGKTSLNGGQCNLVSNFLNLNCRCDIVLSIDNPSTDILYDAFRTKEITVATDISEGWRLLWGFIPFMKTGTEESNRYKENDHNNSMLLDPARELYMSFEHTDEVVDPSKFFARIDSALKKKWSLSIGNKTCTASARLSDSRMVRYTQIKSTDPVFIPKSNLAVYNNGSNLFIEASLFVVMDKLQANPISHIRGYSSSISKLFFCRQIQLHEGEFVLFNDDEPLVLLVVHKSRYLTENQFKLKKHPGGRVTARVCLEDSGYQYVPSSATRPSLQLGVMGVVIFGCSVMVQGWMSTA